MDALKLQTSVSTISIQKNMACGSPSETNSLGWLDALIGHNSVWTQRGIWLWELSITHCETTNWFFFFLAISSSCVCYWTFAGSIQNEGLPSEYQ